MSVMHLLYTIIFCVVETTSHHFLPFGLESHYATAVLKFDEYSTYDSAKEETIAILERHSLLEDGTGD